MDKQNNQWGNFDNLARWDAITDETWRLRHILEKSGIAVASEFDNADSPFVTFTLNYPNGVKEYIKCQCGNEKTFYKLFARLQEVREDYEYTTADEPKNVKGAPCRKLAHFDERKTWNKFNILVLEKRCKECDSVYNNSFKAGWEGRLSFFENKRNEHKQHCPVCKND